MIYGRGGLVVRDGPNHQMASYTFTKLNVVL